MHGEALLTLSRMTEHTPSMIDDVTAKVLREHLGDNSDRFMERFRFWVRAGVFSGQAKEGEVGRGNPRRFSFEDVLMARLVRDFQALTQGHSLRLLKKLIEDLRGTIESPLRQWTPGHRDRGRAEKQVLALSWAGSEYRVMPLKLYTDHTFKEFQEEMTRQIGSVPYIVVDLSSIEAEEREWFDREAKE